MQFVTKEQILTRFKNMDIIDLNEMISAVQEMYNCSLSVKTPSEDKKKKFTKALFMHPQVIKNLREAANDTEIIRTEEEFMRVINEVRNGK